MTVAANTLLTRASGKHLHAVVAAATVHTAAQQLLLVLLLPHNMVIDKITNPF